MVHITRLLSLSIASFLIFSSCQKGNTEGLEDLNWQLLVDAIESNELEERDSLWIDFETLEKLASPEKAALAYISSRVGNECKQVGTFEENNNSDEEYHLTCSLTSALDLGYQCEETHLEFLRTWFKMDALTLEELESCYSTPWTATAQTRINQLKLARKEDKIYVFLDAEGINVREDLTWEWKQTLIFQIKDNAITRIDKRDTESGI